MQILTMKKRRFYSAAFLCPVAVMNPDG